MLNYFHKLINVTHDFRVWTEWSRYGMDGIVEGYREIHPDYPPLSFALLCFITEYNIMLTLWIAWAVCWYLYGKRFALGTMINIMLGYLDVLYAIPLWLALNTYHIGFWFAVSFLIKWQPLIILPFYVVKVNNEKRLFKEILKGLVPVSICLMIWQYSVIDSFMTALNHNMLHGSCLNLGYLISHFNPGRELELIIIGYQRLLFWCVYTFWLWRYIKSKDEKYIELGCLSYVLLNSGVHENHWFLLCCLPGPRQWIYLGIMNVNLAMFYWR